MSLELPDASSSIRLATSLSAEMLAVNSQERLRSILATLEQCLLSLVNEADHETADLLSLTILHLRMKLRGVTESELKLLSDTQAAEAQAQPAYDRKAPRQRRRRVRPVLGLVE